jgi:HK97 family phage portal protein
MANLLSSIARLLLPPREDFQTLAVNFPDLEAQAARIWARTAGPRAWRPASIPEALGVPSILSAVSLISGTVGRLSMEAYQNGTLILDQTKTPRLIVRPNPRSTPREFFMLTAFYQATRGEFWWWVAHRDVDGNADALYPVPPWEVTVKPNPADRMSPYIYVPWIKGAVPNQDMRHQIYLPDPRDPTGTRGVGPLQMAGAAVSVAVEADAWAGNFFSGKLPSIVGSTDQDLDENDLVALDQQWSAKANNLPRWLSLGMELKEPPYNAQKAQLTESRQFQVGEVSRMFDMPGPLLEYQMSGSSLTYRNEADIWTDFQQRCLSPHYLEPMQQEISDLLVRSISAKFNTWELTKADQLTRFQVYESGITKSGMLTVEDARRMEGLDPGDVNFAPVPQSPPSANVVPFKAASLSDVRCQNCNKHLADTAGPGWSTTCPRCKTLNSIPVEMQARNLEQPQPQPVINVHPAPVNVEAPQITFERGAFEAADLSSLGEAAIMAKTAAASAQEASTAAQSASAAALEASEAAKIPSPVHVDTGSFVEAIADLKRMLSEPRVKKVLRDKNDKIIGIVEEIA